MKADLIVPCGMNCRLCYGDIRPHNQCFGCRGPEEKKPKSCTACKVEGLAKVEMMPYYLNAADTAKNDEDIYNTIKGIADSIAQ